MFKVVRRSSRTKREISKYSKRGKRKRIVGENVRKDGKVSKPQWRQTSLMLIFVLTSM